MPEIAAVANFFGWCGTLGSLALFASPASTFAKITRERTTGSFALLPYTSSLLNGATWVSYTFVTPDRLQTLVTNVFGVLFAAVWLSIYMRFSPQRANVILQVSVVVLIWALLTVLSVHFVDETWFTPLRQGESPKTEFMGMFCIAFNIILYGSPLSIAKTVIETKSVDSMPLPLSVATTVCSAFWSVYAIMVQDAWVGLPNVTGTVLGFGQLCLYAYFYKPNSAREGLVESALAQRQIEPPTEGVDETV